MNIITVTTLKLTDILISLILLASATLNSADIDRRTLIEYRQENKTPRLNTRIGKALVEQLLAANGEEKSTTSCRLENKRVVADRDLQESINLLEEQGITLEDRETKNLGFGKNPGTFTFYGTALKFAEAPHLPKTSIKLRIRMYIINIGGQVMRSLDFERVGFLEIKIKNPYPEYPQSVHKYRLILPDEDLLLLIKSDPTNQENFFSVIEELKSRAHGRDKRQKDTQLIHAMFEKIALLAIAEPSFIKPTIGITYYRHAKQYKNIYRGKIPEDLKTRHFEITIDEGVKAFHADFSMEENLIDTNKYFANNGQNRYLITAYPPQARVVEFKQPDAIGYDGPGVTRKPHRMDEAQSGLWFAFVGSLDKKIIEGFKKDKGKFSHIKSIMKKNQENDN